MLISNPGLKIAEAVRPPWSIATFLTLSMVAIIAAFMIVLIILDIRRERAFFRDDQQERGELLIGGLGDTLADLIYFKDVDALRDISTRLVSSLVDVDYIQLWDVDGSLLAASTEENLEGDYPTDLAAPWFGFENAQNGVATHKFQGNRVQLISPIPSGPDVVGIIQIGFNSDILYGELNSIIIQRIWLALAIITIGIVLSYLIGPLRLQAPAGNLGFGGPNRSGEPGRASGGAWGQRDSGFGPFPGQYEGRSEGFVQRSGNKGGIADQ